MNAPSSPASPSSPVPAESASPQRPPQQWDVIAFAREGGDVHGVDALAHYPRLLSEAVGSVPPAEVTWRAVGQWRTPLGGAGAAWLHLTAHTTVPLTCQRCLTPVNEPVAVDRWFRFVKDEATAEREDDDCEEDLLVASKRFDLHALIEDELLMALPMVPMHGTCPVPVKTAVADAAFHAAQAEPEAHPFAQLAALKKSTP